jgi:hypothetical protein
MVAQSIVPVESVHIRRISLVGGLTILLGSVGVLALLGSATRSVKALDTFGRPGAEAFSSLRPWTVELTPRVISVGDSGVLTVVVPRDFGLSSWPVTVSYDPVVLALSPLDRRRQANFPPDQGDGSVTWIVRPLSIGRQSISVNSFFGTRTVALDVRNVVGLTARQARLVSWAGSVLGPMLTLPWWLDWWRSRQRSRRLDRAVLFGPDGRRIG